MSNPAFKHLKKEQLKRRVKIYSILIYLAFAIAIASFVIFFATQYDHHWSWLLIGATYTLWPFNFIIQIRRMRGEIAFRDDRLMKKQEAAQGVTAE